MGGLVEALGMDGGAPPAPAAAGGACAGGFDAGAGLPLPAAGLPAAACGAGEGLDTGSGLLLPAAAAATGCGGRSGAWSTAGLIRRVLTVSGLVPVGVGRVLTTSRVQPSENENSKYRQKLARACIGK